MARQLLLVRHACIAPELGGRYIGSTDCDLGPEASGQVQALSAFLRTRPPATCFFSPLLRARRTAEMLCAGLGIDSRVDADLREVDFGDWEGLTFDQIACGWQEEVEAWARFSPEFTFPGGERVGDFLSRIHRVAKRLANDPAEVVLAVAHGGVVKSLICHYLGVEARQYLLFRVPYATCGVIELHDVRGVLSGLGLTGLGEGK